MMQTHTDLVREKQTIEAREQAFRAGIEALVTYLISDKFHADPTVQVADVLRRITHAHSQAVAAEWAASEEAEGSMNDQYAPEWESPEHEPGCDGTGRYHGRHDCRYSGEPEAGCFATCEQCW